MTPSLATVSRVVERAARDLGLADDDVEAVIEAVLLAWVEPPPEPGLTAFQARIVRALRLARGRMLSREDLLLIAGSSADAHTIDVQLAHIAKRRPDLRERIEVVWSRGFRWVEKEAVHG